MHLDDTASVELLAPYPLDVNNAYLLEVVVSCRPIEENMKTGTLRKTTQQAELEMSICQFGNAQESWRSDV